MAIQKSLPLLFQKTLKTSKTGTKVAFFGAGLLVANLPIHGDVERQVYPRLVLEKGPAMLRQFRIDHLVAYRFAAGKWGQVPLQVDERNVRGDFVLNSGLPFTKDSDDGYVDRNDDVCFWGPDFGDSFSDEQIPSEIVLAARAMWRLEIRSGKVSHGFLLIAALHASELKQAFPPMVAFDPKRGVVETDKYQYKFRKDRAALLGQVGLKKGRKTHPLFKDSQFKLDLVLPWYLPNLSFNQDDFSSVIESWHVGPLRTIVAVGVKFRGFLALFDLHLFSELSFSNNGFQIPTVIEFPFDPKSNFKPGTGIAYGISFAEDLEWQLRSNLESLPAKSPEDLYKSAKRASEFPHFYALGQSPFGDVLVRVKVDEKAAALSLPPYIVAKGSDMKLLASYWPWVEDLDGDVRVFLDISSVPKGSYDFGLDLILADEASEDIISGVDALRTHWSGITSSSR